MGSTVPFRARPLAAALSFVVLSLGLAGCGGGSSSGAKATTSKSACASLRSDLTKMENRGLPALVERSKAGGKLSSSQKADVKAYNQLLNDYLGARCHE